MRILIVHNRYQHAGGEDTVCDAEFELLRSAGHDVERLIFDNHEISGRMQAARTALLTPYNPRSRRLLARSIAGFAPDIVHVHNWFPLASPAIFDACAAHGVPVVWTLHNFRVTCVNALLFRNGRICEDCLGRSPVAGILHRCYRGSLGGSAIVAATEMLHAALGTWAHKVDRFIALNSFARDKFIQAGLPRERIVVKPNFLPDPGPPRDEPRAGALYIGRLSVEKGVDTLIQAWQRMPMALTIVGTGPEEPKLRKMAGKNPNIHFAGHCTHDAIASMLLRAQLLVVPSLWYENFPMVIVEALAHGVPALVSSGGALAQIVTDGVDGWHFAMGDAADLARVVRRLLETPSLLSAASTQARRRYEQDLTPVASLRQLEAIYAAARPHVQMR
ncbi:glycosyltransferase [Stakelama sp. CBK3Z-3]|uniref:Glycosyltransferase n=1 Tax=Stakelama flava TaxID=2860338 RepID=A0ABS6XLG9_9SPHN|nr:glycosyltransferase [Stakelama flava]MBW4330270.1 glycosyltransferase [Stakelama flava]